MIDVKKPYKELAGQTLIYGLGTIIPRVFNFLLTPLYTYVLIESNFGIIAELYSYVAFFMVLLTFGMETTFFRYSSNATNRPKVFDNSFFTLLITSSLFLTGFFIFREPIARLINHEQNLTYLVYLSLIIFFDVIVAIPLAKLRLENKALTFSLIRIGNILINLSLNIFFYVICRNSENNFLASIYVEDIGVGYAFISNLAASLFNFLILLPSMLKFRFRIDWSYLKTMLKYALPLVFVGFAGMVNEVSDKVFLKFLYEPSSQASAQVGIYAANYKLAILMTIFIQVFKYAAEPFFFKQATESDAKAIYAKVMTYFVIFCLAIFLMVTLYIDVFKYFIGANYRVGLAIVPIVLLANMFLGIYYNLSVWYKINDLTRFGALISFFGMIITVVLNILLIPLMGYMGSAIATFVCYFSMMLLSFFYGRKYYKVIYDLKSLLSYFSIALFLFFIDLFLSFDIDFLNILKGSVLFIIFLLVIIKKEGLSLNAIKTIIRS
ncbi:MAG: polysaccharide biosynthesis protein [Bacteroidetes bacterium HGW-Bacteroidetes-4]|nr:MAG: polysaccharide biosynthesis protein [Bacteroidetes bacterium HGW-Bacteroidetes-4]